ncbi:MAG: 3-oxoacyl-ACP synthase III family protein [Candidatus Bipolaricaulia bacterium]
MRTVGLLGVGSYLPEREMANSEWESYCGAEAEWIAARTGIKARRIASPGETTVDLAVQAAEAALAEAGIARAEITELILATDTPEVFAPDTAAFVQHRLGLAEIPAYDLAGSGCNGFIQGLAIGASRVRDEGGKVLVIAVELISRIMDWQDRRVAPLFGDGAGAAIIGESGRLKILACYNATDGSGADALGLEVGGTRAPVTPERVARGEHKHVVLQGERIFRQAIKRMVEAGELLLQRVGLRSDEIALLITGQANIHIIEAVADQLGIPQDRVVLNLDRYGDTGSAAFPIALDEALRSGRIQPGDHILLVAFGMGFHWGGALLRY